MGTLENVMPQLFDVEVDDIAELPSLRAFVREHLRSYVTVDGHADSVVLVLGELVTNAFQYGEAPYRLEVSVAGDATTVTVRDAGDAQPNRRDRFPDEVGGFGLNLVDAVTSGWGVTPRDVGKEVWATIPHDSARAYPSPHSQADLRAPASRCSPREV